MLGAASGKLSVTLGSRGRRKTKIDGKQASGDAGVEIMKTDHSPGKMGLRQIRKELTQIEAWTQVQGDFC